MARILTGYRYHLYTASMNEKTYTEDERNMSNYNNQGNQYNRGNQYNQYRQNNQTNPYNQGNQYNQYNQNYPYNQAMSQNNGYYNNTQKKLTAHQILKIVGASILLLGSLLPFLYGLNALQCFMGAFSSLSDVAESPFISDGHKIASMLFTMALIIQPVVIYGGIGILVLAILKTGTPSYKKQINSAKAILGLELLIALSPLFYTIYLSGVYGTSPKIFCTPGMTALLIGLLISFIGCNRE